MMRARTMNGKFSTKTQKLNGRMDLYEHMGWRYEDPENSIYEHNIHVEGLSGNYNFKGDG
jgi:hypothetical protein